MHKTASQLLSEIEEIGKELNVYASYKDQFLKSLAEVKEKYKGKQLTYTQYERQLNLLLQNNTKDERVQYFDAYQYSLLKRIELILDSVSVIIRDDRTKVEISPVKKTILSLPKISKPASKKVEVFNIDNEIALLNNLVKHKPILKSRKFPEKTLQLSIENLSSIKEEIEKADLLAVEKRASWKLRQQQATLKARTELEARIAAVEAKRLATEQETVQAKTANAKELENLERRRKRLRFFASIKKYFKLPQFNFSPKKGLDELKMFREFIFRFLKKLHFTFKSKSASDSSSKPVPSILKVKAEKLISFASIKKGVKQPKPETKKTSESHQNLFASLKAVFSSKKPKIFVEDIVSMERSKKKEVNEGKIVTGEVGIAFGWFSPARLFEEFMSRFKKRQEPILGETTAVPLHMKKLRELRKKLYKEERLTGFDSTLLAQEAKRIKRLLDVEQPAVYKGSSLGLIANVTVRKITLFLVNNFPQFFGYLYNALRAANVRVLSNTYVNIMVLVTVLLSIASFFLLLLVFFSLGYPIYQVLLRSLIFSIIATVLCATIFYAYPFMKIRDRRRKTTTNLPFAINHMSAVSTSGVPPAKMFELISASGEYADVGVEIKKIVDFTNIFGYDLLTAIRSVTASTPSLPFKKFLEGMVSTIETGGDLVSYLRQQADGAALTYKLERQRYNETVNTYSDIYTGVLIAAPLFFIAAMALVNLLGGSVGGLGVDIVMAMGAYVVIPVLNIGFIIFLQMTQPEV